MYRITFEGNALYIFEAENGLYTMQSEWANPLVPEWIDINGSSNAASIVFDPLEKEEAFTPIIKHSLKVNLIRENESQFTDIISGDDNNFFAVVLRGGALISDATGNPIITKTGTDDARLLFYGSLINETYGESFMPFSEVSLTFFDKIGELSDLSYYPTLPAVRVSDMLADLLHTIPTSKTLLIEWGYSYLDYDYGGERIDQFYLNVSEWIGKKKLDILKQFLLDTKLQLFIDYEVSFGVGYGYDRKLFDSGAIRIKCVAKHTEPIGIYNVYRLVVNASNSELVYNYSIQEGEPIITEKAYSQFYFLTQNAAPPITLPNIVLGVTHKNIRYYIVAYETTELNQAALEALGCIFPCVAVQYKYTLYFPYDFLFSFGDVGGAINTIFTESMGWSQYSGGAGGFSHIWRAVIPSETEDIVITHINTSIFIYYSIADYVENGTIGGYNFSEGKTRYVLGSSQNPIINRNANYNLARKAKHLTAELTYKISEDLIFPTKFELEYFESVNDQIYYNYGRLFGVQSYEEIVNYFNGVPLNPSGTTTKAIGAQYNGDSLALAALNSNTGNYAVAFNVISLIKSSGNLAIDVQAITDEYEASVETWGAIYLNIYAYYNGTIYYYRAESAKWETQILGNKPSIFPVYDGNTLSFTGEIPQPTTLGTGITTDTPYKILAIVHFSQSLTAINSNYYINSASIKLTNKPILPRKLTLKTILNDSMRKPVEFKSEFCTLPDIDGAIGYYRNGFMTESGHPVHTMYFRGLEQTLLAHASDQYGYNYTKERWESNIETLVDGIRLFNLFELDSRVMALTGGTYDVRRNKLKGNFVEVAQLDRLGAWLWDDSDNLVFEDGDRILL